ncbi:MAG: hypothetical protein JO012_18260 [Hyphomicrobiales bacterium]|nr:hypothetical protein [Hyphomicrobiales bacterium]
MKTAPFAIALGATLLLAASTVVAQARGGGGGGAPQACAVDLKSLCAGITPGEGRIRACMMSRMGDVSVACSTKLSRAIYVAKECEADVRRFCGNVKPGRNRIAACMRPHLREVGGPCKGALAFVAAPGNNP